MTPTRALMAVRVWLRASERISVSVLGILAQLSSCTVARYSHGAVSAGSSARGAKRNAIVGKSVDSAALPPRGRGMNRTTSALTTRLPIRRLRSEIRARARSDMRSFMAFPSDEKNVRHDRGLANDHFGREPYPLGAWGPPARALPRAASRRRSRAPAIFWMFGCERTRTTTRLRITRGVDVCGVLACAPPSDFGNEKA